MTKKYGVALLSVVLIGLSMNSAWAPTEWLTNLRLRKPRMERIKLDPTTAELLQKYETYVNIAQSDEGFPGAAIAVVKGGKIIYTKGFGVKDVNSRDSVDANTVFRLASLSKGFAPVLAGMLKEDGCLQWDEKVVNYVPDFQLRSESQTRQINLIHLLSHTVGLPPHSYDYSLDHGDTYERLKARLKEVRLSYKPGEMHTYQNVAYSVVGDVVRNLTGKSYGEMLSERIFKPLGMYHSSTGYKNMMAETNVAQPHKPSADYYYRTPISDFYYSAVPAAGVNASAADMGQWLLLLLGHRPDLISKNTLDQIFTPRIKLLRGACNCGVWQPDDSYYAMGWRVIDKDGRRVILHGGYVNSYRTEIAFSPEDDLGIVVLSNGVSRFIGESTATFFQMFWDLKAAESGGTEGSSAIQAK